MIFKKSSFIILFLAIIFTIIALFYIDKRYQTIVTDVPKFSHQPSPGLPPAAKLWQAGQPPSPIGRRQGEGDFKSEIINLKSSILLPVPFTPQAPTANWDKLHNEACEEASAIMAAEYFSGNKNIQLDPKLVEGQIAKLTKWQDKNFGYHLSVNSQETAQMIKEVYGLKAEVAENFSKDDIKKALAQGKLVLLPANGRMLKNPYYKRPGPKYHMLVIKGFVDDNFITNDPGTKRGLNYMYTFDVLYGANGNYQHTTDKVNTNAKNIIVVWK